MVHQHRVGKYACGHCKDGVTTAEGPPEVLPQRSADASLLAQVVVSKYADHTPLTRLAGIYARSGAEMAVSTLADWVAAVAERVAPIVDVLEQRVQRAYVIGTDATGLKVLDPSSAAHIQKGTIWCYVGDGTDVVYKYAPTGEGETGPWTFLHGRDGYVQADAASVFDRVYNGKAGHAVEVDAGRMPVGNRGSARHRLPGGLPAAAHGAALPNRASGGRPRAVASGARPAQTRALPPCAGDAATRPGDPAAERTPEQRLRESHALCPQPVDRADAFPRRRAIAAGQQLHGTNSGNSDRWPWDGGIYLFAGWPDGLRPFDPEEVHRCARAASPLAFPVIEGRQPCTSGVHGVGSMPSSENSMGSALRAWIGHGRVHPPARTLCRDGARIARIAGVLGVPVAPVTKRPRNPVLLHERRAEHLGRSAPRRRGATSPSATTGPARPRSPAPGKRSCCVRA